MAIEQANVGNTGAATPASVDVTLPDPTTAGAGRYVVIVVACDNVVDTPAGFSVDRSQVNNAGHYHFRKQAADGEDTWAVSPASGAALAWWVAELSGLDADDPLDQVASNGTGASGTTQTSGTTADTAQADELAIASFSLSVSGEDVVTATGYTNDFVEQADTFTTKLSGTDIGLAVAAKTLAAAGAQESTVTWDSPGARTGIMVTYKLAAAGEDPAEGSAAIGLNLAVAATGARDSRGVAAAELNLALAAAGGRDSKGAAGIGLNLAVAAAGARPSRGVAAFTLNLALAAVGPATPLTPARSLVAASRTAALAASSRTSTLTAGGTHA